MKELVIEFDCNGHVEAMHSDAFDLGFLGDKKIRRQSDIKFNEGTQLWDIVYLGTNGVNTGSIYISGFSTYEGARDLEVLWLNECRLQGVYPATNTEIAGYIRGMLGDRQEP